MAKSEGQPKLKETEYLEWKISIEFMGRKKAEMKAAELESKVMSLEYQNKALQMQLFNKTRLESAKAAVENAHGEYNTLKEKIESRLGISLNEKIIDEVTLEVKDIPKNN